MVVKPMRVREASIFEDFNLSLVDDDVKEALKDLRILRLKTLIKSFIYGSLLILGLMSIAEPVISNFSGVAANVSSGEYIIRVIFVIAVGLLFFSNGKSFIRSNMPDVYHVEIQSVPK